MKIAAGIDIGSLSTDAVLFSEKRIISSCVVPTGANVEEAALSAYEQVLKQAGLKKEDINIVISTGYGRNSISFTNKAITEITCHAVGARFLFNDVRTVIDIGGQDSKVIKLSLEGRVEDFAMNDKCAAGTGRFLEVMARSLGTNVQEMGQLSLESKSDIKVSSTCTVFAESEVVALVAGGASKQDIINGLHNAVSERIIGMVKRLCALPTFVFTGGVAKNIGVAKAVEAGLGYKIYIPSDPQIVGALGAAITGLHRLDGGL